MSSGRSASLPGVGGHHRPPALVGLLLTHVNEKGTEAATYDFSQLPLPTQFQQDLATVFAARANPTGEWRNIPSSKQGWWCVRAFARWLATQERVPTGVADLDGATWQRFRLARVGGTTAEVRSVRIVRMLLLETGLLTATARREVLTRIPRDKPNEGSYSDEELREVIVAAKRVFRVARDRIRANLEHLRRYRDGEFEEGSKGHELGRALEIIATQGDVPRMWGWKERAPEAWARRAVGGGNRDRTWKRLYLDDGEVMAALVLLSCKEGWNETTIQELKVPERIGGGSSQPMYRVELEKRRRRTPHRYETRTLTDTAPDTTARLLGQIIEVTQPARDLLAAHGQPTDRLLISHRTRLSTVVSEMFQTGLSDHSRDNFAKRSGGTSVNTRRIRKAVNSRHRREPNQNNRTTHDSVYVLTDPHIIEESEDLIALGVARAIAHAETVEAAVKHDDSDMGEETPTATCVEPTMSPYSPWGVACSASFLLCLACHNAVVMPKHLGRLAYLHECLTNRRDSLPPVVWESEWASHYARLHNLRTEHYTEGQWQQSLDALTEVDRAMVDHLLRGDLDV